MNSGPIPVLRPVTSQAPKPGEGNTLHDVFLAEETKLLHYAHGLTGRREIAEEIVQDAFLQLHAHWNEVREPVPWLYRCVRNRSANHHRDAKREIVGDAPGQPETDREAPDEALRRLEAEGHLRLAVAELEPPDQELLRLKYVEDLKYREIAERTGLSTGNVGYKLHHLLKHLAGKLQQLGIDGVN